MPIQLHSFNSEKKVFTDPEAISLFLRLMNVFTRKPLSEVAFDEMAAWTGDDRPGPRRQAQKERFVMPVMIVQAKKEAFNTVLQDLVADSNVVAIFHHPDFDASYESGQDVRYLWVINEKPREDF